MHTQQYYLAQKKTTILSGENYGSINSPDKDSLEQYTAQTDLLKEIRASGNVKVVRQYLIVYHLMSEKNTAAAVAAGRLDPETRSSRKPPWKRIRKPSSSLNTFRPRLSASGWPRRCL